VDTTAAAAHSAPPRTVLNGKKVKRSELPALADSSTPLLLSTLREKTTAADDPVVSIHAGFCHSIARTTSGKLFAWGWGRAGQLGQGNRNSSFEPLLVTGLPSAPPVKQVSCGAYHSVALLEDGQLFAWGSNKYGQLGLGHKVDQLRPQLVPVQYSRSSSRARSLSSRARSRSPSARTTTSAPGDTTAAAAAAAAAAADPQSAEASSPAADEHSQQVQVLRVVAGYWQNLLISTLPKSGARSISLSQRAE